MNRKTLAAALATCLMLILAGCSGQTPENQNTPEANADDGPIAIISVQDYGDITVELDAAQAPETVQNFIDLAQDGFYDGLTFHRIISGFMIQGGDPNHNGTGGSEKNIKGEFASNDIENNISHKRGVISMARAQDPDSASSQFFIVHQDSDFLDGEYAAFGHVTDGMDIVDKICEDANPIDDNGTIEFENQPVITTVTITNQNEAEGC